MIEAAKAVVCGGSFRDLDCERSILGAIGVEVVDANHLPVKEVLNVARNADALMTDYFPVDADMIGQLERCKVICRYGIGVDKIDVDAATRAGIIVTRSPDYCVTELADHAIALLLAVSRRLLTYDADVRSGKWMWDSPGIHRLFGSTLGLVGIGRVGSSVAARAKPIGLRVLAYDPFENEEEIRARGAEPATFERLLAESDLISLHAPLMPSTKNLIGRDELAQMKQGAILVNTARGGLVDQEALVDAIRSGHLGGAGLDVLADEPPDRSDPLLSLPHVVLTPHAGHFSEESLQQVQTEAAEEVVRALTGERLLYAINHHELLRA